MLNAVAVDFHFDLTQLWIVMQKYPSRKDRELGMSNLLGSGIKNRYFIFPCAVEEQNPRVQLRKWKNVAMLPEVCGDLCEGVNIVEKSQCA